MPLIQALHRAQIALGDRLGQVIHTTAADAQPLSLPSERQLGWTVKHRCALSPPLSERALYKKSCSKAGWPILACRACRSIGARRIPAVGRTPRRPVRSTAWSSRKVDADDAVWWIPPESARPMPAKPAVSSRGATCCANTMAREVVAGQRGKHPRWVFPAEHGEAHTRFNNHGFRKARERAAIPCRWHDLRHTFGERCAAVGCPGITARPCRGITSTM